MVLIIEDLAVDAELTQIALQRCGINLPVICVSDGADAIEVLTPEDNGSFKYNIKLIIMDVRLPKVDGFEVLKFVRAIPHWGSVPIVILTSLPLEEDRLRALLLGASGYIPKSVDFSDFCYTLGLTLGRLL